MSRTTGRVYLIRHGRTAGNRACYVGWQDLPLNPTGLAQAHQIARLLAQTPIDRIVCSTLARAIQTATPLATIQNLPLLRRDELREIHYGDFQGMAKTEGKLRIRHDYREQRLPGGESLYDLYQRVAQLAVELRPFLHAGHQIALVGHFWSIRLIAGVFMNIPFTELPAGLAYKPGNGSIASLEWLPGAACASNLQILHPGEEEANE